MSRSPEEFMQRYEAATREHDLQTTLSLIADDAVFFFSNETVHTGKAAIEKVLRHNFEAIKAESYGIDHLSWLVQSGEVAVCVYDYAWSGLIDGNLASGFGRGTSVLKRIGRDWQIVHEHLSRGRYVFQGDS